MDRIKQIIVIGQSVVVSFLLCCLLLFIFDWSNFASLYPNTSPQFFIIDSDLDLPLSDKGQLMVVDSILSLIGLIGYIIISIQLNQIRKRKEEKYISTLLLSATTFFGIARAIEVVYIPISSQFAGYTFAGNFFMAFDSVGFAIFIIFVVQVFLAEIIERNQKLPNKILGLGLAPAIVAVIGIMSYVFIAQSDPTIPLDVTTPNNPIQSLITMVTVICLGFFLILAIVSGDVILKIISLRRRVSEHQKELTMIAIQVFVLFIASITMALTMFSYIIANDVMAYAFRGLKLGLHIVNIWLTYAAFIKPSKN